MMVSKTFGENFKGKSFVSQMLCYMQPYFHCETHSTLN